ncbi:hypothetical protein Bbelb_206550 [Branchiostoma belcheri]|nr:hypothetical protein Bbelb_206550 [Branchiostoma belcheri]
MILSPSIYCEMESLPQCASASWPASFVPSERETFLSASLKHKSWTPSDDKPGSNVSGCESGPSNKLVSGPKPPLPHFDLQFDLPANLRLHHPPPHFLSHTAALAESPDRRLNVESNGFSTPWHSPNFAVKNSQKVGLVTHVVPPSNDRTLRTFFGYPSHKSKLTIENERRRRRPVTLTLIGTSDMRSSVEMSGCTDEKLRLVARRIANKLGRSLPRFRSQIYRPDTEPVPGCRAVIKGFETAASWDYFSYINSHENTLPEDPVPVARCFTCPVTPQAKPRFS